MIEGMTLRDWFAVNAPECPDWFNPNFDVPEPRHPGPCDDSWRKHKDGEQKWRIANAKHCGWAFRKKVQRLYDWPWFYADNMMERRTANAEAHGRAVARTVQPLVGSLDSEDKA